MPEVVPPVDLTTAIIEAVDIALQALGIDPLSLLLGLFSGRPKFEDTYDLIDGLNQSAFWPLHALAADLQEAAKNGAPISDSDPKVQETFRGWKHGTVLSLQQLGNQSPGPQYGGYWTLTKLLNQAWEYSKDGVQGVLRFVRAMDKLVEVMAQHPHFTPSGEGGGHGGGQTGGGSGMNAQEWNQVLETFCHQCLGPELAKPVLQIARALSGDQPGFPVPPGYGVPPPTPPPSIQESINNLSETFVTFVNEKVPGLGTAVAEQFKCLCPNLDKIVEALQKANEMGDVPQSVLDMLQKRGALTSDMAQVVSGASWSTAFAGVLGSFAGWVSGDDPSTFPAIARMVIGMIGPVAAEIIKEVEKYAGGWYDRNANIVESWTLELQRIFSEVLRVFGSIETAFPKEVFGVVTQVFAGGKEINPDNVEETGFRLLGIAWLVGQGIHLLAALASYLGYPMSSVWSSNAEWVVELLGYKGIIDAFHGPLWKTAIGEASRQAYNRTYRPYVPPEGQGFQMFARRKIEQADLTKLIELNGVHKEWVDPLLKIAYRPLSPFILRALFVNRDYPYALMKDMFEDLQLDPKYLTEVNDLMEGTATQNLENSYVLQLEQAVAKGAAPESALESELTELKWGKKARAIVKKRGALVRQIDLINETVKQYEPEVQDGIVTGEQYRQALLTAGAESWFADLKVTMAVAKATIKETVKAQAVAHKDANEIFTATVRAAKDSYVKAEIDLPALTALLTAAREKYLEDLGAAGVGTASLAPEEAISGEWVAAAVAEAQSRAHFTRQFVYGLTLPHAQAQLLRAQVAALEQQFKDTLVNLDQFRQKLSDLGIPSDYQDAIVAKLAASSTKFHQGTSEQPV